MGSLKVGITINSKSVLSSPVSLAEASSVTADSGIIVRAKVLQTGVHASAITVYKASDKLVSGYLYAKNLSLEKEDFIYIYNATDSNAAVAKLGGGEFCFIPVVVDKTYKAYGTKVDQVIDYAVFGLDSSSVTLG
mgnify:CR=1 FL=1|tara:strand:+ start:144 stop:548 length:405 start_codon:yes stop_codon:yes gene_type:complete